MNMLMLIISRDCSDTAMNGDVGELWLTMSVGVERGERREESGHS